MPRIFTIRYYGSRLKIVGDMSFLSQELQDSIERVEELTKDGDLFTLYICFPYTSRNDICNAVRFLVGSVKRTIPLQRDELSVERFTKSMYLGEYSNKCDILIRTSGNRNSLTICYGSATRIQHLSLSIHCGLTSRSLTCTS